MKGTKTTVTIFLFLLLFFIPSISNGLDTDLYVLSGVNIPPNVLIILDSSASMDEVSSGQLYDRDDNGQFIDIDYGPYVPPTGTIYQPIDQVYVKSSGKWVEITIPTTPPIPAGCSELQSLLAQFGEAINFSGCGYKNKDFQTANFRNYLQATGGPAGNRPRFGLATGIIHSYINTTSGVRFAVMAFNRDKDGNTVKYDSVNKKEYVSNDDKDNPLTTPWDAIGGQLLGFSGGRPGFVDENKNGKTDVFNDLATLKNDSWSPLAETLYDAGIVFQNKPSDIDIPQTSYAAGPKLVQYSCQKNYILIISDGVPTKDSDSRLKDLVKIPDLNADLNGNGRIDLDEVSKYLNSLDLNKDPNPHPKQNIKIYTIGFSMAGSPNAKLLEDTAKNGGGEYYYVWSSQSFNVAFESFIAEVLDESVSYVAPVVPISQMERTSAGNLMYLAMFKPTEKSFWKGNIKKYCIATRNSSGDIVDCNGSVVSYKNDICDKDGKVIGQSDPQVGDILDAKGLPVVDCKNEIKKTSQDLWSSGPDKETDAGGVGEILWNRTPSSRTIYTYKGTKADLTDSSNWFLAPADGGSITPTDLGLAADNTAGRDNLIKFIYGYDAYNQNEPPLKQGPSEKRDWILGAFIHSRPVVIHYADQTVIYAGANDGMLHAFDDQTGEELWAFVPPNLLPYLQKLNGEAIQFFVDGPPKAYIERDSLNNNLTSATLIFGERRGGNPYISPEQAPRYTALDVTNPRFPKFLWDISPSAITYKTTVTPTTAYREMGQTWSAPQLGKVKYGDKWVAFISGGYDENQDNEPVVANDTKGRAIYVVDVSNGNLIWSYSNAKNTNMKYCIPSDITRVDTNGDSYIDRLYVGDIGGQVWRFDVGDPDPTNWTAKIIFDANKGESLKRKIFYPPDVTLEKDNYEMIFFGTGDREHPKDTTKVDRLYAIKDKNPPSPLSESDLVDVTQDLLQEGTDSEKTSTLNSLQTQYGWFIALTKNPGEKCLSNSVLFYGDIYYTTFTPIFGDKGDPCFLDQGKASIYALNYLTGNAVFDLDGSGSLSDLTRSDRSSEIGVSIPSGIIVTFLGGTTVAYGGVGGGVYRPPLPTTRTVIPISWRIKF